jgi:hypothetical protein
VSTCQRIINVDVLFPEDSVHAANAGLLRVVMNDGHRKFRDNVYWDRYKCPLLDSMSNHVVSLRIAKQFLFCAGKREAF